MLTAKVTFALVGLALCALAFIPARRNPLACFLRALGILACATLPVGLAQFLWVIREAEFLDLLFGPFAAAPFNLGGLVCAAAFDSIDRAGLMPPRQVTMHPGVYYPLLAAWAGLLAGLMAARMRETGRVLADRRIALILALSIANGVLGITWPWWGS